MCLSKPSEVKTHNYIFGGVLLKEVSIKDNPKIKEKIIKREKNNVFHELLYIEQRKRIFQYACR